MEPELIRVKKVTERKDGSLQIESDNIRIKEIKSYRPWHKTPQENELTKEDLCQVSIYSPTGKDGYYVMRIVETESHFGKRLGKGFVIDIDA